MSEDRKERVAQLSYKDKPRLYTVIAIIIAVILNIAGRLAPSTDPFKGYNWQKLMTLALLEREGMDPYAELSSNDAKAMMALAKSSSDKTQRALSIISLGLRGVNGAAPMFDELLADEQQPRLVKMSALFARALVGGERAVDRIQSVYESTKDDVLKAYSLFALRICGENGVSALHTIIVKERKLGAERFYDFDLDVEIRKALAEFLHRHEVRRTIEKLRNKQYQYYSLPILVILGTIGALYPPCLLLLLPLIYFPYGATLGGWFFLLYISLSNVSRRPPIKMAFSLGIAIVVVACVDLLAGVFNFSLFALCILFNVDVHLRGANVGAGNLQQGPKDGVVKGDDAVQLVISMLKGLGKEREKAFHILEQPAPDFVDKLLREEATTEPQDKAVYLEALGHCKGDKAYERLKERLLHETAVVKAAAIQALADRQNPELLSMFSAMMREKDYEVRISAVNAVAEYGYEKAGPVLEKLLDDETEDGRIIENVRLIIRRLRIGG